MKRRNQWILVGVLAGLAAASSVDAQQQDQPRRRAPREYSGTVTLHGPGNAPAAVSTNDAKSAGEAAKSTIPSRIVPTAPAPSGVQAPLPAPRAPEKDTSEPKEEFDLPSTSEILGVQPETTKESGWGWLADDIKQRQEGKEKNQREQPDQELDDEEQADAEATNTVERTEQPRREQPDADKDQRDFLVFRPTDASLSSASSTSRSDKATSSDDLLAKQWGTMEDDASGGRDPYLAASGVEADPSGNKSIGAREEDATDPLSDLPRIENVAERTAALLGKTDIDGATRAPEKVEERKTLFDAATDSRGFSPAIAGATSVDRDSTWNSGSSATPTLSPGVGATPLPNLSRDFGGSGALPAPSVSAAVGGWSLNDRGSGSALGGLPRPSLDSSIDRPALGGNPQPGALPW